MTTQELEQLIEGQTETQNLDFKADMPWDVQSMAKDFIAMANVRDGGTIVIGVKENGNSFLGLGVSKENAITYKKDIMRDQLARYTDPTVDFRVHFPKDIKENNYVVIKVLPFSEVPIISKTNIPDKLAGQTIYYRNTNKRVESAPVSNSNDLRDIIEAAAIKLMQRRRDAGFTVLPTNTALSVNDVNEGASGNTMNSSDSDLLDKEITNLPPEGILAQIKERGYWQIRFKPLVKGQISTLKECLDLVERTRIRLNWDFPQVPYSRSDNERVLPAGDCYQAESNFGARKEFWRMYQSEQFLMFRGLIEDWYSEDKYRSSLADEYPSGFFLNLYSSLTFLITETFEFLARLGEDGLYKNGVDITLILYNTARRKLRIDSSRRAPFQYDRQTLAEQIEIEQKYDIQKIIADRVNVSNEIVLKILDNFGFNPSADTILNAQKEWLNGTFRE